MEHCLCYRIFINQMVFNTFRQVLQRNSNDIVSVFWFYLRLRKGYLPGFGGLWKRLKNRNQRIFSTIFTLQSFPQFQFFQAFQISSDDNCCLCRSWSVISFYPAGTNLLKPRQYTDNDFVLLLFFNWNSFFVKNKDHEEPGNLSPFFAKRCIGDFYFCHFYLHGMPDWNQSGSCSLCFHYKLEICAVCTGWKIAGCRSCI